MRVAHYITAHGYGHGVRSSDVIRAVLAAAPEAEVAVTTGLGRDFLASRLPLEGGRVTVREGRLDVGMVQRDSVRADEEATLEALGRLLGERERRTEEEARWLEQWGADVVVADIPGIPLAAAAKAGVRGVAMGNFSWAWIYGAMKGKDRRWGEAEAAFLADYGKAELLLQLPFSPAMDEFRCRRVRVPLLARPGRARREELARLTGADPGKRWTLLSFTTLEWGEEALRRVEGMGGDEFFTVEPLEWAGVRNVHVVRRAWMPFSDVVASVDGVVSKPGYGILSDCVANGKGLVYADRTDFAEYPVLVEAMGRWLKAVHVDARELYAGRLEGALERLAAAPGPREALATGGAEVAAGEIVGRDGARQSQAGARRWG